MSLAATPQAEEFYKESIQILKESRFPFMVGGTFALNAYTGIDRETKDVDFFCKPGDYPKILNFFKEKGYTVSVEDERWLAKVKKGEYFMDLIFNASNSAVPVTDDWVKNAHTTTVLGFEVPVIPPAEFIWSKAFIQDRHKYDGADVAHVILKKHDEIDWDRLIKYFDQYWEVLLMHIINFRFLYPSERGFVPRAVIDELFERFKDQIALPTTEKKLCRGRLFSNLDYLTDFHEWGYADIIGMENESISHVTTNPNE